MSDRRDTSKSKIKDYNGKPFLGLSRKLLFLILLVSGLFTITATMFRYYLDFKEETGILENKFQGVEHTTVKNLSDSIWEVNDGAVKTTVQGLLQIDDFIFVKVLDAKGEEVFSDGEIKSSDTITEERTWKLTYDGEVLGDLTVTASKLRIYKKLAKKIGIFFITQFIKTFLTSFIILFIVRYFVVRHLERSVKFFREFQDQKFTGDSESLKLEFSGQSKKKKQDELDILRDTINDMSQKIVDYSRSIEERERLRYELETADAIQQTLFPKKSRCPGVDIFSNYLTASETGGDLYGHSFNEINNKLYLFVGDVSGHGFGPSLLSAMVCGSLYSSEELLRTLGQGVSGELELQHMASVLNRSIYKTQSRKMGLTLLILSLDVETGKLLVLNAGHPHPLIFNSQTGEHHMIKASGQKIGVKADVKYKVKEIQLEYGDNLFLYTDGLVENGHISEFPFLRGTILDLILESRENIQDAHNKLRIFLSEKNKEKPFEDDVATMLISWLGSASQQRKAS